MHSKVQNWQTVAFWSSLVNQTLLSTGLMCLVKPSTSWFWTRLDFGYLNHWGCSPVRVQCSAFCFFHVDVVKIHCYIPFYMMTNDVPIPVDILSRHDVIKGIPKGSIVQSISCYVYYVFILELKKLKSPRAEFSCRGSVRDNSNCRSESVWKNCY